MALDSDENRIRYVGNNSIVTTYPVTFRFDDNSWLRVTRTDADGTATSLDEGLATSGLGEFEVITVSPGNYAIRSTVAVPVTSTLTISRLTPAEQSLSLISNSPIPAKDLEAALDRLMMVIQDRRFNGLNPFSTALLFPVDEDPDNVTTLPSAAARLATFVYFNETTGELELVTGQRLVDVLEPSFQGIQGPVGPVGPAFAADIITESTISRTLALSDNGKYIRCTNGSTTTLTIPVTGTGGGQVDWPVGAEIYIRRAGTGAIALSIVGVTVNGSSQVAYVDQHQNFTLKHLGSSVWDFI